MAYIDKSDVIAEIEKIYDEEFSFLPTDLVESVQDFKDDLLRALNTLETKEVDLEKEYKEFVDCDNGRSMFETAKHFFELGLKTRKGGEECITTK